MAGAVAAHYVPTTLLELAFGAGLLVLGGFLVYYDPPEESVPGEREGPFLERKNTGRGTTTVETKDGETFTYDTCWRPPGVGMATAGGFITGLISAGLPEITTTQLIVRCQLPPRVAIATSVFALGVAAIAGAAVHALAATPVWHIVAWSIPGVVIGGTVNINAGVFETFTNEAVTPTVVLASAAVPSLFEAVEIEDHYHWDGLFSQNPPVDDLMTIDADRKSEELWVIQINPQKRETEPRSLEAIDDRRNELSGNISLNQELRFIEHVNEWIDEGYSPKSGFRGPRFGGSRWAKSFTPRRKSTGARSSSRS